MAPQKRKIPHDVEPELPRRATRQHPAPNSDEHLLRSGRRPTTSDKLLKPPPTPRSDRNIDKVVLGNICFKAWYPSYYGKEVLGDISHNTNPGGKDGRDGGGKMGGRIGGSKRQPPPMLERLYVCPCCFKYSRELVAWWEHVRCCEKTFEMPGRKVYKHPKGLRTRMVKVPSAFSSITTATAAEVVGKGKGRKKSDGGAGVPTVEEVVSDDGEWSVWEVDGEKDRLFCQNLSLFAKLFLDNKSVFFDVTGFNYFLLVYTPPPTPDPQTFPSLAPTFTDIIPISQSSTTTISSASQHTPTSQTRPQVVGFFSKEKLSWDNNNLACILVFPPWQRKGLGALLMGVSYEISRREGILGGPEKPISELGRKGYKRFWGGEIARWLLELKIPEGQGEDDTEGERETLITVEEVSKATWIVPEDCLAVLREMGVVEDASPTPAETATANGSTERRGGSVSDGDVEIEEAKTTPRVRLDREAVRRWVSTNKIDLTKTCDPDGFVEGYAVREGESEEVDEE
ncbi:Males-absent on the first protein [Daldinia childiae]|uniref:Males-absent on the first protein n=1 Tax=Daldinia childiae TaxID=326645 RepID=UPI0014464E90|nr:Males-absent on the first protein [Daldinia childiae]KAF3059983.1 Males-absent on the first protein [Daldinia childiae]